MPRIEFSRYTKVQERMEKEEEAFSWAFRLITFIKRTTGGTFRFTRPISVSSSPRVLVCCRYRAAVIWSVQLLSAERIERSNDREQRYKARERRKRSGIPLVWTWRNKKRREGTGKRGGGKKKKKEKNYIRPVSSGKGEKERKRRSRSREEEDSRKQLGKEDNISLDQSSKLWRPGSTASCPLVLEIDHLRIRRAYPTSFSHVVLKLDEQLRALPHIASWKIVRFFP